MGRVLDAIEETGQLDNTLVIYIQGDNGASAEGTAQGLLNEMSFFNAIPEDFKEILRRIDELGDRQDLQPLPHRLGARDGHAVPVDEADRFALRRHAQRTGHLLAGAHQGQGWHPDAVPSRHRHRADDSRGRRPPAALRAERCRAEADRRREHGLHVRRCESAIPAPHSVLRDARQSRDLQRRLDGSDHAADCALGQRGAAHRRERLQVGALPYRRGLQRSGEPGRQGAGQAARAPGTVLDRGRQIQRAADRQQPRPSESTSASVRA